MSELPSPGGEPSSGIAMVFVNLVIVIVLFVLYILDSNDKVKNFVLYFPAASILLVVGVILGAIFYASDEITDVFAFDSNLFFRLLLPPIIFNAGFTVNKFSLFSNIGTIILLSVVGTFISSLLIGGLLYTFSSHDTVYDLNMVESFIMGSLISAVDPVSTMAVFQSIGVKPQLYNIVFGESIFNDAVSIVISRSFNNLLKEHQEEQHNEGKILLGALPKIIGVMLGSTIVGIVFGIASALIHKHLPRLRERKANHQPLELAMIISMAYLSYVVAEELMLSGIMSILFCGIVMDHYTVKNLSLGTKSSSKAIFNMLAHVSEAFVFVYLGMAFFTHDTHKVEVSHIMLTLLWCFIGRAVSIFPLIWLFNGYLVTVFRKIGCCSARIENRSFCCRERKRPIDWRQTVILWLSGIRGAVAFAVAYDTNISGPTRDVFITTTLIIIFVTTALFGSTTYPVLNWLNVNLHIQPPTPADMEQLDNEQHKFAANTKHWFMTMDRVHFQKWFTVPAQNNQVPTSTSGTEKSENATFLRMQTQ